MKPLVHILLLVLLFNFKLFAQSDNPEEVKDRISTYLSEMEHAGYSGNVLLKIRDELISKTCGFSNRERKIQNSPNTIFDIGSITKQFTAVAILKLEMQGKLSTSDPISNYFENIPEDKGMITIHDLLRHQSGLISNVGKDFDKISEADFLNKVFASKLKSEPGTTFSYSNIGYSLLGIIIEKISGQSYESYLAENLFKPAEMEMTGYSLPAFDTSLIATGYDMEDKPWGKPTSKAWDKDAPYWHLKANGGILSTLDDMYKWHVALMSEMVLNNESKEKLYHPQLWPEETSDSYYAYGWDVAKTDRNTTRIWHNGTNHIFYADFARFIDEDVVIIVLSNKYHPYTTSLALELSRMIFKPGYEPEELIPENAVNRAFTAKIIKSIQEKGLENTKAIYKGKKDSEQLLEYKMRDEGFNFIDNGKPEIALKVFEMNVFAYPNSSKALQGLGEGYMETGNKDLALKYFEDSLKFNPDNRFVKDMVKTLQK